MMHPDLERAVDQLAAVLAAVDTTSGAAARQGVVVGTATDTFGRVVTVAVEALGEIPARPFLHVPTPDDGDAVWVLRAGPSRWFLLGVLG